MQALSVNEHSGLILSCWQTVEYGRTGNIRQRIQWSSSQERELFAYLLHHRGQPKGASTLAAVLWPGDQSDKRGSVAKLAMQLSHTLDSYELSGIAVKHEGHDRHDERYMLALDGVTVDVEQWEKWMNRLEEPSIATAIEHERALAAYTGDYLAVHPYRWAEAERERLRALWLSRALKLSDCYMRSGASQAAMRLNHRIQQLHPYVDNSYINLMKLYDDRGDRVAADKQCELLCIRWLERFGSGQDK